MKSQRVGHDWATSLFTFTLTLRNIKAGFQFLLTLKISTIYSDCTKFCLSRISLALGLYLNCLCFLLSLISGYSDLLYGFNYHLYVVDCHIKISNLKLHFWALRSYNAAAAKSLQLWPTLCNPIDGSPPGSPVPGILQARTLEWVTISFSNGWKWKVKVKSCSVVSDS